MTARSPVGRGAALVRNTWRGLTSMRTALMLLFLLALAAIPGALLPQRSLNESKVAEYIAKRPTLGPWMDRLELFDVFGSFWFTAVYVLLFISLVGCILPRCLDHYRALRTPPAPAPRNLARLPHHWSGAVDADPRQTLDHARARLRGWRITERTGDDGQLSLSAEKGYLREVGNLVFHLALVGLLVALAVGKLFGYEGNVMVIANGPGICSTSPAAFDSFRAGNVQNGTGLTPVCVRVKDFAADYLDSGQAKMFTAHIDYQAGADLAGNAWRPDTLQVNHPLRVSGDRIYLQGHGYAPTFTVTFPDGRTRTETVEFRPDDATTFLSSGVLRIDPPGGMYSTDAERRKHQIAIEGLFAPTAFLHGSLLSSSYPAMTDPAVAVDVYVGDTGLDSGKPQNLFALDPALVETGRLAKQARVNLRPGQSTTLKDGVKVTFDGAEQFVNLQFSHDPAQGWVLASALTMMGGLLGSLLIRRRRIWIRVVGDQERRSVVELGGLARTDHAGWGDEFDRLRTRLIAGITAEESTDAH
ncbi:MAG: cytochrome c biogenesis protein ResB [Mycobacteriaceae bacterium]|nr:cytochrome c biogenesis protein ResB [Mycobacteriaceae bacterium]